MVCGVKLVVVESEPSTSTIEYVACGLGRALAVSAKQETPIAADLKEKSIFGL